MENNPACFRKIRNSQNGILIFAFMLSQLPVIALVSNKLVNYENNRSNCGRKRIQVVIPLISIQVAIVSNTYLEVTKISTNIQCKYFSQYHRTM